MPMQLKTIEVNGQTYAEIKDGKPIYVHDDGKEVEFDAPGAMSKISALNAEAKGHREKFEAADGRLKAFDGIEDPEAARHALATIKNLDEGKLITAGKVEEIKSAARRAAEESLEAAKKAHGTELQTITADRDKYKRDLHNEKIGNAFARSRYISEKIAVPVDLVQAQFGRYFSVDDQSGKIIAKDANGGTVHSRHKFGDPAEFEEAIEILVGEYPHKDSILKGTGNSGSGARPSNIDASGKKTMKRSEFDRLSPMDQHKAMTKDHMTLVD